MSIHATERCTTLCASGSVPPLAAWKFHEPSTHDEFGHDLAEPLMCPTAGLRTTRLARAKKLPLRVLIRFLGRQVRIPKTETREAGRIQRGQNGDSTRGTHEVPTGTIRGHSETKKANFSEIGLS